MELPQPLAIQAEHFDEPNNKQQTNSKVRKSVKRSKKNELKKKDPTSSGPSSDAKLVYEINLANSKQRYLCKKVSKVFESWLSWQRKIVLCGLTERCTKSFLVTMATVIEPISHFSFRKYPFAKSSHDPSDLSRIMTMRGMKFDKHGGNRDADMDSSQTSTQNDRLYSNDCDTIDTERKQFLPEILNSITQTANEVSAHSAFSRPNISHAHKRLESASCGSAKCFFPDIMISNTKQLGRICSVKQVIPDTNESKGYFSTSFKNRKWWNISSADHASFHSPKRNKLLQNFCNNLDMVYKWFNEWNDAGKGQCLLHLLASSQEDELEYFSQCILQRLKDRTDIDSLPDKLMINIFKGLSVDELLTISKVSKRWHYLAMHTEIWKEKCRRLGVANNLYNVVHDIEKAAEGVPVNWRLAYVDLLNSLEQRKRKILEQQAKNDAEIDSDDDETADSTSYCSTDDVSLDPDERGEETSDDELDDSTCTSVSGMSAYLNGDLGLIEDTVQQMTAKANIDETAEEDTALDIRPDVSVQARNKLIAAGSHDVAENTPFMYISVDGIRSLKRVRKLQGHLEAVLTLQFDRKRVMTGSADRTIRVWDVRSGRSIHKLKGHKGGIRSLKFDNEHIVTASWDMTIMVWDAVKFKRIKTLHGHEDCVSCLDMDDDILVSGSHDKTLRIWRKGTWKCSRTLKGHHGSVTCLTLLEDGRILSGSSDRTLRLWDPLSNTCLRLFHGSTDVVLTVQACGGLVAAGSSNGQLFFWNLETSVCEAAVVAHNGAVHSLAFCGSRFVTAGGDQLVKEWDLATCCCLRSFTGHKDVVLCVQASARRIVSGSADGTVRIWDMDNKVQQVGGPFEMENRNIVIARTIIVPLDV